MKKLWFALGMALFGVMAYGQGDTGTIAKIVDEGKNHSHVMNILKDLTSKFGPRLTSSTNLERAQKWAMDQFKKYGCTNVHLEQWGEFPVGFDRGKKSFGRMTSPEQIDFEFTTPSWTPGTRGALKAKAVKAPTTVEEFNAVKSKLKGAWLVYTTGNPPQMPRNQNGEVSAELKARLDLEKQIDDSGIAGRVTGSRNELVITSGNWRIDPDDLPTARRVLIRKSDMDKIAANMDAGKEVELEFNLDQKFVKGPRPQYNVVAEIKGTEKPDEVVIVSGHFDSWDGPNGQGALDNGTGSSVTLEAARILNKVEARPKRTIRFILWSGEEQGLFGSRGYVALHMNEMDKISAVLVDDGGTNYQGGYVGLESQREIFERAFSIMNSAFPDLPEKFNVAAAMPRGGGSDHASFNAVGVPGYFTIETGRSDYNFVHHTQHDRYEMAIPEYLVQSATNHAVVSYNLACLDQLVPRGPKPTTMPDNSTVPGLDKLLGRS
ncbi:MAG TPA: M20/M25/M40 family metallo-hydrolase [Fimbriimonadaceae bacterium]|nr:M20/M25/M40 family metallo-hydrolase [Fimbriimonadaceae bacterium]